MSRLTLAVVRKSEPMPPSPPLFDTAAASSADVQVPIGARMIGTSMPNKSHRVVLSMCAISKWRRWPGRKRDDFSLYVIPFPSDRAPGARRPSPVRTDLSRAGSEDEARSTPCSIPDHEGVVAVLGDLPPEIFVVAQRHDRVPDSLIVLVDRRSLGVDLFRCLQAGLHDRLRERTQLRAGGDETFQGVRIAGVVSRLHFHVGI